jgi:hypothetical protein
MVSIRGFSYLLATFTFGIVSAEWVKAMKEGMQYDTTGMVLTAQINNAQFVFWNAEYKRYDTPS